MIAANRPVTGAMAERVADVFTEVIVAPGFDEDALEVLARRTSIRLLALRRAARAAGASSAGSAVAC